MLITFVIIVTVALIDVHADYANKFVHFACEGYSTHRYFRIGVDKTAHIQEYLDKTKQKVLDRCVVMNDFYAKRVWNW